MKKKVYFCAGCGDEVNIKEADKMLIKSSEGHMSFYSFHKPCFVKVMSVISKTLQEIYEEEN